MKRALVFVATMACAWSVLAVDQVAWETGCDTIDGWHGNNDDPGMQANIAQGETGVIKITQDGADTWGKAAFVVENVDISKCPILEIKVNKVDKDAGFKVMLAPRDWSETVTVIARNSADGIHKANVQKAVEKDSKDAAAYTSFNIVVVIEGKGKSVWLDDLKLRSE